MSPRIISLNKLRRIEQISGQMPEGGILIGSMYALLALFGNAVMAPPDFVGGEGW